MRILDDRYNKKKEETPLDLEEMLLLEPHVQDWISRDKMNMREYSPEPVLENGETEAYHGLLPHNSLMTVAHTIAHDYPTLQLSVTGGGHLLGFDWAEIEETQNNGLPQTDSEIQDLFNKAKRLYNSKAERSQKDEIVTDLKRAAGQAYLEKLGIKDYL